MVQLAVGQREDVGVIPCKLIVDLAMKRWAALRLRHREQVLHRDSEDLHEVRGDIRDCAEEREDTLHLLAEEDDLHIRPVAAGAEHARVGRHAQYDVHLEQFQILELVDEAAPARLSEDADLELDDDVKHFRVRDDVAVEVCLTVRVVQPHRRCHDGVGVHEVLHEWDVHIDASSVAVVAARTYDEAGDDDDVESEQRIHVVEDHRHDSSELVDDHRVQVHGVVRPRAAARVGVLLNEMLDLLRRNCFVLEHVGQLRRNVKLGHDVPPSLRVVDLRPGGESVGLVRDTLDGRQPYARPHREIHHLCGDGVEETELG